MQPMGKILLVLGLLIAAVGVMLMFSDKIPLLGKLPGDINIKRENFEFHFPVATGIIISIVLSAAFWMFSHCKGK